MVNPRRALLRAGQSPEAIRRPRRGKSAAKHGPRSTGREALAGKHGQRRTGREELAETQASEDRRRRRAGSAFPASPLLLPIASGRRLARWRCGWTTTGYGWSLIGRDPEKRLAVEDAAFARDTVPAELKSFPKLTLPRTIRHASGFSLSGAPVGTFLRASLLLAGQKVFGPRYEGSTFYQAVEADLAFKIMHSHFHRGFPKGVHCCVQCTLAVYPVLAAGGIRYFDSPELARNVKHLIEDREWRFAKSANPKLVGWALNAD